MKILHIPFGYYPDTLGGTEVYVANLAKHLLERGMECVVCAPGSENSDYEHESVRVRRFEVNARDVRLRTLYGEGDDVAAAEFARIIESERPDIVHLHAFTMGVSIKLLREAKRRGCRVVFTYHTPTVSCVQGSLFRASKFICDGKLNLRRCSCCVAREWGLNRFAASIVGHLPVTAGKILGMLGLAGGLWTAMRCTELIVLRHASVRSLFGDVDRIVALCSWGRDLLLTNGVPNTKITLCRQGLARPNKPNQPACRFPHAVGPLRVVFFGRADPSKGADVLIEAFARVPDLKATLDLYCIKQDRKGEDYEHRLKSKAAADRRIRFHESIAPREVVNSLRDYDLLAVPSQGLETGPLVVLEAFAAQVPVIGSNLGGLKELLLHQVNGLLLEPRAIESWVEPLRRCSLEPGLLRRLREGIRPPRTMEQVATEMAALYRSLC